MRKLGTLFFAFVVMSCSQLIDRPKNLIPKDDMAELIAEFAVNDQLNSYLPATNMENATRFVLKKNKISAASFNDSYKYYLASGELDKILDEAQEIILKKDKAAAEYIRKKNKENKNATEFAR